jgi:CheY-like chemotaxis protein
MIRNEALDLVVVDDNPVLISVLSEIFHECGHRVRVASGGFAALAEIGKRVPDILLSDLGMPGMSGYELLSVVRRRFPSIRVIAMSGAYSGTGIPPGVAADAFYAKGSTSVDQLVQTISAIWREDSYSPRSSAPIWIPGISTDSVRSSVLFVSCPECLRLFSQRATDDPGLLPTTGNCPHCMSSVEFALVRQSEGTDGTPISIAPVEMPTGRMHQQ